jgi:hypothetical protein
VTSVAEIWRYPVKSLKGEQLERVELVPTGLPGDRLARIEDDRGTVTALRKQRMVGVPARIDADGEPEVDGSRWNTPEAAAAIRAVSGDGARIVRAEDGAATFDVAPILVATDGALDELGFDRRRFRPNIVLEGVDGLAEREWLGKKLTIGDAVLKVSEPCERCGMTIIHPDTLEIDPDVLRRVRSELGGVMGMYCKVERPGRIAVGDDVTIE